MKTLNTIFLFTGIFFLLSCSSSDTNVNLLKNGNFTYGITNDWWPFNGSGNEYFTDITDTVYFSKKYSASISSDTLVQTFAYWGQTIKNNLPVGSRLKLKLKIKIENVTGNGVGFAVRFDDADGFESGAEKFTTTQGIKTINGTHDWKDYEITSEVLTEDIENVTIYLLMFDNTTGKVYFDDAELIQISE